MTNTNTLIPNEFNTLTGRLAGDIEAKVVVFKKDGQPRTLYKSAIYVATAENQDGERVKITVWPDFDDYTDASKGEQMAAAVKQGDVIEVNGKLKHDAEWGYEIGVSRWSVVDSVAAAAPQAPAAPAAVDPFAEEPF
ncbi:MAG: hypothetical protein GY882_14225 [Actinomycetia bacterium]|nr:hypothetical protein [Actinomycetes bacterium]